MKRYVLTPNARKDVNDIWDYISSDSIEAADRFLDALESAMIKLAKSPGIGHWREELADKRHRFLQVYSYLIVYRHEAKPLQIVRVLQLRVMCKASWAWHRTNHRKKKVIEETPCLTLRVMFWTALDARARSSAVGLWSSRIKAFQTTLRGL